MTEPKYPNQTRLRRLHRITDNSSLNHWERDGILYESNRASHFTHITKGEENEYFQSLYRDLNPKMPSCIILASGIDYIERFFQLNAATNYILVDYEFKEYSHISNGDKQIVCLNLDAIVAIRIIVKLFKIMGMTISAVISQNEGLAFGGGNYVLNTNLVMGLLFPVLDEKLLIVGSKAYLKKNSMYNAVRNYNKLPYQNIKQMTKPEELLELGINQSDDFFTTYHHSSSVPDYTLLENKIKDKCHSFNMNGVKVNVIQGSIFDNSELDAYFILAENTYVDRLIRNRYYRVFEKRGKYKFLDENYDMNNIADIIRLSNNYGLKKLGFIPFGSDDYVKFLFELTEAQSNIEEISFYHFHNGDYPELYNLQKL